MPINVTIQPGDNLPLARLLNSGGVPPRVVDIVWATAPTNVNDPTPGADLFPITVTGNEVLIASDASVQGGLTYTGVLQGTVTDDNGNFLVRLLDVDVTIAAPVIVPFSFCDPTQWEDIALNSPPVQWEAINPGSNAYEWDDTTASPPNAGNGTAWVTYIGNDDIPVTEIEVFYAYNDNGNLFNFEFRWEWLDNLGNPISLGPQGTIDNVSQGAGTGSIFIGVPPSGAVTLRFEVDNAVFSFGYGVYLALGCTNAVWNLIPPPPGS